MNQSSVANRNEIIDWFAIQTNVWDIENKEKYSHSILLSTPSSFCFSIRLKKKRTLKRSKAKQLTNKIEKIKNRWDIKNSKKIFQQKNICDGGENLSKRRCWQEMKGSETN